MMGKVICFYRIHRWLLLGGLIALTGAAGRAEFPKIFEGTADHPSIGYSQAGRDPVAALNQKIKENKVELRYDKTAGYLKSVLDALQVPIESQIVAYSKTSVQRGALAPTTRGPCFLTIPSL
jgi:hypothetical protein